MSMDFATAVANKLPTSGTNPSASSGHNRDCLYLATSGIQFTLVVSKPET